MAKKKKSFIREWLEAIFIALIVVLIIRSFLVEAFMIPTPSMEGSLLTGDFIIVNKAYYGPRTLRTPLSFPFAHQTLPFLSNVKGFIHTGILPYFRLPGFGEIKHNDIVVFNYPLDDDFPVDHKSHYIKRCVALPGDTLNIKNSSAYINGSQLENPEGVQFNYAVKSINNDPAFFRNNSFSVGGRHNAANEFRVPLNAQMVQQLSLDEEILSIIKTFDVPGAYQDFVFPYTEQLRWNIDHFGPIIIPEKNHSVKLTSSNIYLYKRIIEKYEGNELEENDGLFYINGEIAESYTFKMNYYFMMGDNRHYSSDSRFWGFVPEDHILGKASMVMFSLNPQQSNLKKIRWDRFFTLLN
ncbi:MAG: signal peptidase I [Bacteroidetes bacterium]|nr:signal peptidase I [Bacteroidota bacterium]